MNWLCLAVFRDERHWLCLTMFFGCPSDLCVVKIMVNYGGDEFRGLSGLKCQVGVYVKIVVNYGENR